MVFQNVPAILDVGAVLQAIFVIYTVWIVSPVNYIHSKAFTEVATAIRDALAELGHDCRVVTSSFECRGRTIVLGANLLNHITLQDIPKDIIIWNMEQIFEGSPWLSRDYLDLLRGWHGSYNIKSNHKIEIWDYSQANIDVLTGMGIKASLCEIGYMPCLSTIESVEPEIDVLHVGSITDRRMKIINDLAAAGAKVHFAFGVYGKERDDLIAKSKIVLNVHFYESRVFEIVRCSHLMANKKCIVSETGSGGERYNEGIVFVEYDGIVDCCVALLGDDHTRKAIAQKGFEIFSKRSQVEFLRGVL